jgi:hypothetical protein
MCRNLKHRSIKYSWKIKKRLKSTQLSKVCLPTRNYSHLEYCEKLWRENSIDEMNLGWSTFSLIGLDFYILDICESWPPHGVQDRVVFLLLEWNVSIVLSGMQLWLRIQKPAVTYDIVSYDTKAVCPDLFAALPKDCTDQTLIIFANHCWNFSLTTYKSIFESKYFMGCFKKVSKLQKKCIFKSSLPIQHSRDRCYDHKFLRFFPIVVKTIGVFLKY